MGLYRPCGFGLSVAYNNDFREQMERRSRDLERHDREGNLDFELSLITGWSPPVDESTGTKMAHTPESIYVHAFPAGAATHKSEGRSNGGE